MPGRQRETRFSLLLSLRLTGEAIRISGRAWKVCERVSRAISRFVADLSLSGSARGFKLTFKGPKEEQSPLIEYDEKNFDHLIMMAPSTNGECTFGSPVFSA
jgi:hypothetical protein